MAQSKETVYSPCRYLELDHSPSTRPLPRIAIPPTASTSYSDPSNSFKTTMPQPATFDVKALARFGHIVAYQRPMADQMDTVPTTNTTKRAGCSSSYAQNVQRMNHSHTTNNRL